MTRETHGIPTSASTMLYGACSTRWLTAGRLRSHAEWSVCVGPAWPHSLKSLLSGSLRRKRTDLYSEAVPWTISQYIVL